MENEIKLCKHCKTEIPKAAKICPICHKKQRGIAKWIVIILVVLMLIGMFDEEEEKTTNVTYEGNTQETDTQDMDTQDAGKQDSEYEEPPRIEYMQYSVTEMMNLLDSNALNAESTFLDQYVEITGRVSTIDGSGAYIVLLPEYDDWAFVGVRCYIQSEEQLTEVAKMSKGNIIKLKGKVTDVQDVFGYELDIHCFE